MNRRPARGASSPATALPTPAHGHWWRFGRSRRLSGSSSTLVFGIVPVEFGPFFVDDMRVAALVGWPRERILDVDLANRRGVASAGAVDQFLQIWRFAVVGQVSPPLAQNGSTAAST